MSCTYARYRSRRAGTARSFDRRGFLMSSSPASGSSSAVAPIPPKPRPPASAPNPSLKSATCTDEAHDWRRGLWFECLSRNVGRKNERDQQEKDLNAGDPTPELISRRRGVSGRIWFVSHGVLL